MKLVTKADAGQWVKATTAYEKILAKASTLAMRDVGKEAVRKGRASIASAGFSSRFARSLRAINKPKSGYVLNPAVYVHSTIDYSDVFETGKTITKKYLWLPLPSVPSIKGREHMTPSQYIRNVGPLVLMWREGGRPMLGAVIQRRTARARRFGLFATRGRLRRGRVEGKTTETVPLFVGFTSITIPKKFDVKGAIKDAFEHLDEFYRENFEPYEGRR